jgi:hypothetical protein
VLDFADPADQNIVYIDSMASRRAVVSERLSTTAVCLIRRLPGRYGLLAPQRNCALGDVSRRRLLALL